MTLVLHQHPFASYCQKVLIALYELELPFERRLVDGEAGRAELAAIWPPASIPVLVDSELTLPESTTIIEYANELAGGSLVPSLEARLWDRVVDNHVATPMQKIVGDRIRPAGETDPHGVRAARAMLDTAYGVLEGRLAGARWLAGEQFTLADCAAAPALFYTRAVHRWDAPAQPNIDRYYRELVSRASVARVIDEARPYRSVFPHPWPDDIDIT